MNKSVGQKIRALRKRLHMSQTQLAGDEMSRAFISQIEHGKTQPSPQNLSIIAKRIGRPVEYFISETDFTSIVTFLIDQAHVSLEKSDIIAAVANAQKATELAILCEDLTLELSAYHVLGSTLRRDGRLEEAYDALEHVLELAKGEKPDALITNTYLEIGNCCLQLEEFIHAKRYYLKAVSYTAKHKSQSHVHSKALIYLGSIYFRQGSYDDSIDCYKQALQSVAPAEHTCIIEAHIGLSSAYFRNDDVNRALEHGEIARQLSYQHQNYFITEIHQNLGVFESARGNWESAYSHWKRCLDEYTARGDVVGQCATLEEIGRYWEFREEWDEAVNIYTNILELLDQSDHNLSRGRICRALGLIYKSRGCTKRAHELFQMSACIFRRLKALKELSDTLEAWGKF